MPLSFFMKFLFLMRERNHLSSLLLREIIEVVFPVGSVVVLHDTPHLPYEVAEYLHAAATVEGAGLCISVFKAIREVKG